MNNTFNRRAFFEEHSDTRTILAQDELQQYELPGMNLICDEDNAVPVYEQVAYELIHALLGDVARLAALVMETRCATNWHTDGEPIFKKVTDQVMNDDYIYLPAMDRYVELYGDEAVKLWDGAIDWGAYE